MKHSAYSFSSDSLKSETAKLINSSLLHSIDAPMNLVVVTVVEANPGDLLLITAHLMRVNYNFKLFCFS